MNFGGRIGYEYSYNDQYEEGEENNSNRED
jgi:hypothetical protein